MLREWVREEAARTSLRKVAETAGVGRPSVTKFLTGHGNTHPRVQRALALLYLGQGEALPPDVDGALSSLLGRLPVAVLPGARLDLLAFVGELHRGAGVSAPEWAG
jgi:hypothetical protein